MNTASSEKAVLLSPSLSWARACQLEGAQDAEPIGPVWRTTYQRILKGWGSLTDPADSNRATHWPPLHPSQLDEVAKQQRIDFYYRVWSSADVIKASAMRGHSVSAAFYVTQEWEQTEEGKLDFAQVEDTVSLVVMSWELACPGIFPLSRLDGMAITSSSFKTLGDRNGVVMVGAL
jgi:hypothetical protein